MAKQLSFNTALKKIRNSENYSEAVRDNSFSFDAAVDYIKNNKKSLSDIDRENRERYISEGQAKRRQLQGAIELAKNSNTSQAQNTIQNTTQNTNAGNNRTTATPNNNYLTFQPAQRMNEGSQGANVDYSKNNEAIQKKVEETKGITEEQSYANASNVIAPYIKSEEDKKLLDEYVATKEKDEIRLNFSGVNPLAFYFGNEYSKEDELKEEIIKKYDLSDEQFDKLIRNYQWIYDYESSQKLKEDINELPSVGKGALAVVNRVTSIPASYMSLAGSLTNKSEDPELGRNFHSTEFFLSDINEATNEAMHNDINTLDSGVGKFVLNHAYDLATMMGDAYIAAGAGNIGLASYGANSYSSNLEEGLNRGLPENQAQAYATVMGITEIATEKIPFDHLSDLLKHGASKEEVKGLLSPTVKAILVQFGEEGGEEVANDIVDDIADGLINGDQSKNNIRKQYYMSQEYADENNNGVLLTEDEALALVVQERALEYLQDGVMGGLSGAGSAGLAIGSYNVNASRVGGRVINNEEYREELLNNPQSPYYLSEDREDYETDKEFEDAQRARQTLIDAAENQKANFESRVNVTDAVNTAITNQQKRLENTQINEIKNATTPLELETAREKYDIQSERVNAAAETKKAELESKGANEEDFKAAITPKRALERGKAGETISEKELQQLPEETQKNYTYGKVLREMSIGRDITKADVTDVWVKGEKKQRQKIERVKFNNKGELTFITDQGKEVNAYKANYSNKGEQIYKSENGILSLQNPALIQLAVDTLAETDKNYPIGTLTQAIKTMNTLGKTQGVSFEKAIENKQYLIDLVGKDVLEKAFNAYKDNSSTFDEGKKVGAVKTGKGVVVNREENEEAYDRQFDNKDIQDLINSENKSRNSLTNGKQETIVNKADEAIKAFEDLSDAQKLFLERFSKKLKVDFDFIYAKNAATRGAYMPHSGKIMINLYYANDMFEVALHEGIGEFLQAHNAKGYNAITTSILNYYAATQSDELAENIEAYQRAYKNKKYRESFNEMANDAMGKIFSTDEGLTELINWLDINETAEQAETVKKTFADYFNDFKQMIADILKKGGLKNKSLKELNIAKDQAADYAKQLIKALNEATVNRDVQVGQQGESAPRNSIKISYENQIDELVANTFNPNSYLVLREGLPEAFIKYAGMTDAPVVMNYRKAKISMDESGEYSDHYHNLGPEIMKQIPKAMEDPEMILRLPNGRINAILKIVDKKGRTILISLEMDKGKYIDKKYAKFKNPEQAVLITAFGAKPRYIEKLIDEGDILYPKEKASSDVHEGSQRANPSIKDAILNNSVAPEAEKSTDNLSKNSEKTVDTVQERKSIAVGAIEQQAIEHFGTTDSFRVAGYMLQDGTLLDFSGAHWLEGEDPAYIEKWKSQNDIRQVDHEDIYEVMEASGDNRKQFMDRGNIRLNPEAPGFNLSTKVEPTAAQYRELKEFIREIKKNPYYDASRFYVDIEDTHPNKISYANNLNEDRIINDIKKFYETGELPQQSNLNDFRYSKAVFGEASRYEESLQQADYISDILSVLNNQLKGQTVSMKYLDDTVKYIVDKYQANLDEHELELELAQFISYMTKNDSVDYKQMMNYLLNIGDQVIAASDLKDPESERVYQELKDNLKSYKIRVTEQERKELSHIYGGWNNAFAKLNAAGIKLDNKGATLDSVYTEIADNFRTIAGIQLDTSIAAEEQLLTIIDTMEAMQPSAYEWEGANDMDKALDVATTIIDRYYSMATAIKESNIVKGTEKGAAAVERAKNTEIKRLRKQYADYKGKLKSEFDALVEDKKRMIQEQQEFYRRQAEIERKFARDARAKEKKFELTEKELEKTAKLQARVEYQSIKDTEAKRKQKENIIRTCTRLINWMNKPTDARHVPTFLKPALTEMIKSINFMPASMRKGDDGTISAKKWQETMRKLQSVIREVATAEGENDSDKYQLSLVMEADNIVSMMQQLLDKYNGIADISRMSKEDLKMLSDIMTSISRSVSHMNENFMNRRFKHVSEAAATAMDEMDKLRPMEGQLSVGKFYTKDFLNLAMVEPITFFEELGDASSSIMQEFFDGEAIGIEIIREADYFFNNLADSLNLETKDIRKWENDYKEYKIDGQTLYFTPADIMSLYCSYHRETIDQQERPFEATHHIAAGGIKGYTRTVRKGVWLNKINANPTVVHPSQREINDLIATLTPEQKEYADSVVNYMSTTLAAHGNETSNKLNGYSKFLGRYYFPIKTDSNTLATTESNNMSDNVAFRRLINPSFTKSQLDKADNPLVVMNFFDVVTEHITGMSNYCAYSMPISDALRWYNYAETERNNTEVANEYIRDTKTLKGSMERVHGSGAKKYFEDFIRDVNLDNKPTGSTAARLISQGLTGLAKAKAVGLNIRVILQQPCAMVRARDVIESKYLTQGWAKMTKNPKKAMNYAQSNNSLAYWKSKGFSDTRVSQSMKEIITGQETVRQDIVEKTGVLAGLADDVTWAAMYYAAEAKVKATKNLN